MDYNDSSYEWNYQDSMQKQIRKNLYPESNTIFSEELLIQLGIK